jgi:hypothetical protein
VRSHNTAVNVPEFGFEPPKAHKPHVGIIITVSALIVEVVLATGGRTPQRLQVPKVRVTTRYVHEDFEHQELVRCVVINTGRRLQNFFKRGFTVAARCVRQVQRHTGNLIGSVRYGSAVAVKEVRLEPQGFCSILKAVLDARKGTPKPNARSSLAACGRDNVLWWFDPDGVRILNPYDAVCAFQIGWLDF